MARGRSKYHAVPTVVQGIRFDSKAEARRFEVLRALEDAGKIADLRLQPAFRCVVNGTLICTYRADFSYVRDGRVVVEDVKGVETREFKIKRKMVAALHGVTVETIPA